MPTYRWGDAEQSLIVADDGRHIPVDPSNHCYRDVLESGAAVAPYVPPVPPPPDLPASTVLPAATAARDAAIADVVIALAERVKAQERQMQIMHEAMAALAAEGRK
jgi:hypothetical protein